MGSRPGLERLSWGAGIVSALIAIVAFVYSIWPAPADKVAGTTQSATNVGNQIGTVSGDVTIVNGPAVPTAPPQSKLNQVFRAGIVGNDVQWFDNIAGPPLRKTSDGRREYEIEDCRVDLVVRPDQTIVEAKLYVSPVCSFNWRSMDVNYADLPPPNALRFGDIMAAMSSSWTFKVSCLSSCGNSHDPYAELTFGGSHANSWLVTTVGAIAVDDDNLAAWSELSSKLEGEMGRDAVVDQKYGCDYDLNAAAVGTVERMKVHYISFAAFDMDRDPIPGDNYECKKHKRQ